MTALTFAHGAPGTVYAGTDGSGLFRSIDGGATWEALPASPTGRILAVAVDPADPQRILIALETAPFGLWRSRDAGASWQRVPIEPDPTVFFDVAFDPVDPRTVYAGSLNGLHRSTDGGETWPTLLTPPDGAVFTLVIDPGDPETIFVVFDNRLYRSTDGGVTFALVLTEPQGYLAAVLVDPVRPGNVWVGGLTVYRSVDGGATFLPVAGSPAVTDLAEDPRDGTLYAAGGLNGEPAVFRSADGVTWTPHDQGLDDERPALFLALDPGRPDRLLTAATEGLFASDNRGETWAPSQTGLDGHRILALTGLEDAQVLLASVDPRGEVLRSEDGGATWTPIGLDFVGALEKSPADLFRVWAFTTGGRGPIATSTDGGRTFAAAGQEILRSLGTSLLDMEPHPTDPDGFAVGLHRRFSEIFPEAQANELWTTADGGETWTQIWDRPELPINAFATEVLPGGPILPSETLYWVATPQGLFRVAPAGSSVLWAVFPEAPDIRDLVLVASTLYVVGDEAILRTDPTRKTGTRIDAGLPAGRIVDLTADPILRTLYVAVEGAGVFRSTDQGASWQRVGPALPRITGGLLVSRSLPQLVRVATRTGLRELALTPSCVPDAQTLCFQDGRFEATVDWQDFQGHAGVGHSVPFKKDTGAFWFFDPDNLELMVKVLDGRPVNSHFWVFYGALTNVGFELTVTDTVTGLRRVFSNPLHRFASAGITDVFFAPSGLEEQATSADPAAAGRPPYASATGLPPAPLRSLLADPVSSGTLYALAEDAGPYVSSDLGATWSSIAGDVPADAFTGALAIGTGGTALWAGTEAGVLALERTLSCQPGEMHLCLLDNRFEVSVTWHDFQGGTGPGRSVALTPDTGAFWFFHPDNLEMVVKVIDGRSVNGHFWVFFGALTNVGFELTVTDTVSGKTWTRDNPTGTFASIGDALAFPGE